MFRYAAVVGMASWLLWAAASGPCCAQDGPALPEGVTHVRLPPGAVRIEHITRNGKPLLRLSVGKAVIEGRSLFLGDGKNATEFAASEAGIHWPTPKRGKGDALWDVNSVLIHEPGSTIGVLGGDFLSVNQLKPGSVYLTTPSLKFEFRHDRNIDGRP